MDIDFVMAACWYTPNPPARSFVSDLSRPQVTHFNEKCTNPDVTIGCNFDGGLLDGDTHPAPTAAVQYANSSAKHVLCVHRVAATGS
jgi:hypothetical protein